MLTDIDKETRGLDSVVGNPLFVGLMLQDVFVHFSSAVRTPAVITSLINPQIAALRLRPKMVITTSGGCRRLTRLGIPKWSFGGPRRRM
jgi:hypothetical protein